MRAKRRMVKLMAISERQPATFVFEEHRNFIFIMDTQDADGDRHWHFFLFDEDGWCVEARYNCHPQYMAQIEETLIVNCKIRPVWELVPHGNPPYPDLSYCPQVRQKEVQLSLDKLYAIEILQTEKNDD